ncbi:jg25494 [Pararge aegeria aegeria]|uniref:Jg25494 protein n=1 Tax=Pararge aegeria aegeria TaxID=348720 RepID=A0A8S4S607_9NEOP|nr:jg25494 [Pararge aegeria aegeria]
MFGANFLQSDRPDMVVRGQGQFNVHYVTVNSIVVLQNTHTRRVFALFLYTYSLSRTHRTKLQLSLMTLGPWGPEARALFKELSKRVIESTGDPRAGSYLGQRISLAIQRGNAASILGTVPRCGGFEDVLDFI